jgi:hypothetical protein
LAVVVVVDVVRVVVVVVVVEWVVVEVVLVDVKVEVVVEVERVVVVVKDVVVVVVWVVVVVDVVVVRVEVVEVVVGHERENVMGTELWIAVLNDPEDWFGLYVQPPEVTGLTVQKYVPGGIPTIVMDGVVDAWATPLKTTLQ